MNIIFPAVETKPCRALKVKHAFWLFDTQFNKPASRANDSILAKFWTRADNAGFEDF
jgi:hypothetical protein